MSIPSPFVRVPFGTDQLFTLLFDYDKAALLDAPQRANVHASTPASPDLREVRNLSVHLEGECGFAGSAPFRLSEWEGKHNALTIELRAASQHLGRYWAVVAFDLPSDRFADGAYRQTRRVPLCHVVPAESLQTVRPYPRPDHVLLLSSGAPVLPSPRAVDGRNLIIYSRLALGVINRSNIQPNKTQVHDPTFYPTAPGDAFRFVKVGAFAGWETSPEREDTSYGSGYIIPRLWFYDEQKKPLIEYPYYKRNLNLPQAKESPLSALIVAPPRACFYRYEVLGRDVALMLQRVDPEHPAPVPTTFTPSPEDVEAGYVFREVVQP